MAKPCHPAGLPDADRRLSPRQVSQATLTPRIRGMALPSVIERPIDPIVDAYRSASAAVDVGDDDGAYGGAHSGARAGVHGGVEAEGALAAQAPAEAAGGYQTMWERDPVWEASETTISYAMRAPTTLTHAMQGDDVRPVRADLSYADSARHISSEVYVQREEQLADAHVFDVRASRWVALLPSGRIAPRSGHSACAISPSQVLVFGGWRLRECEGRLVPCGEPLNDVHVLHLPIDEAHDASADGGGGAGMAEGLAPGASGANGGGASDVSDAAAEAADGAGGGEGAMAAAAAAAGGECCESSRWEAPLITGLPPLPRTQHSASLLPDWRADAYAAAAQSPSGAGDDAAALERGPAVLVLFGLGWVWNATTRTGSGTYLNDAHLLHLGNMSWAPLHSIAGSPPAPRAGHTATVLADGSRVVVLGGTDDHGPLSDAHLLDLSQPAAPIWWQLQPIGSTYARHSHTAHLIGVDLVVLGGMPPRAAGVAGMTLDLLHLDGIELQTSAPLADRIAADAQLARGCTLVLGTPGSPVQRWSCGLRLPTRVPNATAVGADTW